MEKRQQKNDRILLIVFLTAALLAWLGVRLWQERTTNAPEAVVTVGGAEYGRFLLEQDHTEKIELSDGSYNLLEIREGAADVTQASCPDGVCVAHKPVSRQGESIICLPNQVVVEIHSSQEAEIDAVVK